MAVCNQFTSIQTAETAIEVPGSSASFIRFWFERRKGFPVLEQLVGIADNCASAEVDGVGDFKAALTYSSHRHIVLYSEKVGKIWTMTGSAVHSLFGVIDTPGKL